MPFEPRLFPNGEDGQSARVADEIDAELPDDLAAVAAQLRDDAEMLARQYPPALADFACQCHTQRRRRSYLWPAAAVVAAAAGLMTWRTFNSHSAAPVQPAVAFETPDLQKLEYGGLTVRRSPLIAAAQLPIRKSFAPDKQSRK